MSTQLTDTPAWQALSAHHAKIKDAHILSFSNVQTLKKS